jgi:hypothetical protein
MVMTMILAWSSLMLGLSLFSFRSPSAFANWVTPFHWLNQKMGWKGRHDALFSYSFGGVFLVGMVISKFILGGLFVTIAFRLWTSPFLFLITPY